MDVMPTVASAIAFQPRPDLVVDQVEELVGKVQAADDHGTSSLAEGDGSRTHPATHGATHRV